MLTSITNIPKIMRANAWSQGAMLMEKWFLGPPIAMPFYTIPDLTTIRIDWVLQFPRARKKYDEMLDDKVWANPAARPIVAKHLRPFVGKKFDFSRYSQREIHDIHVNHSDVSSGFPSLDGLVAALGNFSLYVSPISGSVVSLSPNNSFVQIEINRVGFQVMDSYDFEGHQFIDEWDESTNDVSVVIPLLETTEHGAADSSRVYNSSFRNWRHENARGGDFKIFSDVKIVTLPSPTVSRI